MHSTHMILLPIISFATCHSWVKELRNDQENKYGLKVMPFSRKWNAVMLKTTDEKFVANTGEEYWIENIIRRNVVDSSSLRYKRTQVLMIWLLKHLLEHYVPLQ